MSEWIDVDSQLPPEDQDCLATDGLGVFIAWQHNSFWFLQNMHECVHVSHWQPLPEPPQA